MLAELSIKNFAIIEELTISFERGLTVLTGETGAGKSIIIDAVSLLVGGRGSSEFVRYGETKAELEGLFLLDSGHPVFEVCREQGIDASDDMIVMRRDINAGGKSVCRVNGKLVTIAALREIGRLLLDIHGQHDNQLLMEDDKHLELLDRFAGAEAESALQAYHEGYERYMKLLKKVKKLSESEQEMAHRLDLIQFQLEEIESAKLELNEDELLQEERKQISNFEKFMNHCKTPIMRSAASRGLDWVGMASAQLEDISDINEPLQKLSESVSSSYYLLEDATFQMRNLLDDLEYDPERLNFIETRLNEIKQLKRKYGATVEDILEYGSKIEEEIDQIENRDSHLEALKKELESVGKDVAVEAANLSKIRKAWAKKLAEAIHQELKSLYMGKSTFDTEFLVKTDPSASEAPVVNGQPVQLTQKGIDLVKFLISTNTGEPLKPLSKVASGGELSRVMLAMKSIFLPSRMSPPSSLTKWTPV